MKTTLLSCLVIVLSYFSFIPHSFGQRGPGGVSVESAGDSNCKMWLDAGEIPLPDGAAVDEWADISLSTNDNSPTQTVDASKPTYRSDISASINGHPILRFLPSQFLVLNSSADINTAGPYTERSTFLAFRTGSDITTRQLLWEQGGAVRGLNIFIYNGELYFGGYDVASDADGTPIWNYTYTRVPVEPSTVYIVTHIFDGPLGATTGTITGYLNGQPFSVHNPGDGDPATGVGSLWTHPNAPGLGAVNGDSYFETGPMTGATGDFPFLGDMGEFIAYGEIVNDAERIIVENYLGAKYFADLVINDYFDYQVTHGNEIIGIGRDAGAGNLHNTSQGRNLFQIEANTVEFANVDFEYFLIGHDNADISTWTVTEAPNNGVNTLRLSREWKADHRNDVGDVTFQLDANDLPALPAGYTKYCLVVDKSGGAISDFNSASTEVIEMVNTTGTIYEASEPIPNGSYVTIGIVDPTVQFVNDNDFGFELTPVGANNAVSVEVELNYRPQTTMNVAYNFVENTALNGAVAPASDFFNVLPAGGIISIAAGTYTNSITFDILGDDTPELTEDFMFNLLPGGGTSPGLGIGVNSSNTYTIFDDDNTPKVGFSGVSSVQLENAGTINISILRSGNTVPAVSVDYQLRVVGGSGTATDGVDYVFASGTANFPSGTTLVNMSVDITDDLLDELDETVIFELTNNIDCDILPGFKDHTLTIADNDSPPEVQFTIPNSQGPEVLGAPSIEVQLSEPSSLVVQVDYTNLLTGTATFPADYTGPTSGTIVFAPGDTLELIPLFVVNDVIDESDETINYELDAASAVNCTPLGNLTHTYTIKDYSSFEWTGLAGVGQAVDNIFWLKASDLPDADGADVTDFIDASPNANTITQATAANRPVMNFSGPNGQKELVFDGVNDYLDIADDANINTGSFYTRKHVTIAFSTSGDITSRQVIYEQGGSTRGLSIYLDGGTLYYHIWSNANDNGANSAWGGSSPGGAVYVTSAHGDITTNSNYIATLNYNVVGTTGTLEGFLNGASVGTATATTVSGVAPRLYSHGDNGAIGGTSGSTLYHNGPHSATYFEGAVQEVVHYSDAPMNATRRIIVENHFSTKYDISLAPLAQYYSTTYASGYSNEMAGIGQFGSDDNHSDAQGTGMVRINNPSSLDNGDYLLWGHDGASLTTGLLPYEEFPTAFNNRLHRVWKVSELGGDVGTVTVRFDLSFLPYYASLNELDLMLLIDSDDGNFTNATAIETGRSYNSGSGILTFDGVNFNNDQWFTVGTWNLLNPLPIELVEFTAVPVGNYVALDWSTASEVNNDFFTIERSKDGKTWERIAIVPGAGNSSTQLNYQLDDMNPYNGLSYYRLSQTDFDGTEEILEVRSVYMTLEDELLIYPNPASEQVFITFGTEEIQQINVYSAQGSLVLTIDSPKSNALQVSVSELPSGLYFADVTGTDKKVTEIFVVQ